MMLRIGIDTGGTFTDFAIVEDGRIRTWKEPSTPKDPSRAILAGLRRAVASSAGAEIVHGSTVATNALLEGRTARVAFVTNRGFEDILEIGRQARPDLYNLNVERPPSLVPRELRFGVGGRRRADGSEEEPLDPDDLARLAKELQASGASSVAVCLLHSWADPAHEEEVARVVGKHAMICSISSRIVREYREYERASTVTVNAAVAPVMSRYLGRLAKSLDAKASSRGTRLRIMGSSGGALSPEAAGEEAVRTVLSGPAAGVRAAEWVGASIGLRRVISFDMGGTSTDVSLIEGTARLTTEGSVAGHPIRIPTLDIHTVGAGGGSVGWRDPGGALRVGPASAGADPGPACYGRGGPPTVTDANLVLGRLVADRFLDGRMPLDVEAARKAVAGLARQTRLSLQQTAEGMLDVVEATMARAIRVISLFRGHEPGDFALMAFGGAGGLHAASLADALDMERAIIPAEPGVFSALGMTVADVVRDRSMSLFADLQTARAASIQEDFVALERACRKDLESWGVPSSRIGFQRTIDLRYRGQSYELNMPYRDSVRLKAAFHDEHDRRFGHRREAQPVEIVALRVRGTGRIDPPRLSRIRQTGRGIGASLLGGGKVVWKGRALQAPRHDRDKLPATDGKKAGQRVDGPALILESGATTFVPPGWASWLDRMGHLHLRRMASRR